MKAPAVLIAIDPGYAKRGEGCAVARFDGGALVWVGFARHGADAPAAWGAEIIVVEKPQVDSRTAGREAAAVGLAWAGASLAYWLAGAHGGEVREPTVAKWKGNWKKPQHHSRLWAVLSDAERALLGGPRTLRVIEAAKERGGAERWRRGGGAEYYPAGFVTHNLLDAVALGCWELGRLA